MVFDSHTMQFTARDVWVVICLMLALSIAQWRSDAAAAGVHSASYLHWKLKGGSARTESQNDLYNPVSDRSIVILSAG